MRPMPPEGGGARPGQDPATADAECTGWAAPSATKALPPRIRPHASASNRPWLRGGGRRAKDQPTMAGPPDDDEKKRAPPPSQGSSSGPSSGRFTRFARLSTLTAGVTARHMAQKLVATFQSDADALRSSKKARERSAGQIAQTLGELKGAAMKVGQMLSTDPELLPDEIVQQLATLQSNAPPMDGATVRRVVAAALGGTVEDHFAYFSDEPIGAASIGQVHRATTKDGMHVAVKVQYPGIAGTIRDDMKNVGALLNLARAKIPKERVDEYLEELTAGLEQESDYEHEAANLERFQFVLRDTPGVRAPIPVHELTRKNVLTMQLMDGVRLADWLVTATPEQAQAAGMKLLVAYISMIHRHGALHADPHPGNFLVDKDGNIGLLDLGCVRDYPMQFTDDLIRLLAALWKHDVLELQQCWRKLGFLDAGVDREVVYEWLCLVFEPLLVDKEFDFATWRVQDKALAYVKEFPSIVTFAAPKEIVFYTRVLAGMRGLLSKSGVKVNAYRLSRGFAEERGIVPRRG